MYYLIKKNSEVAHIHLIENVQTTLKVFRMPVKKVFNGTWFKGYEKCACCDQLQATFVCECVNDNEAYYYQTAADNVIECADKSDLPDDAV